MMFLGLSGFRGRNLGFTEYDPCTSVGSLSDLSVGESCTLPDGSNIATWNGTKLGGADGSSAIDPVNASALIAGNSLFNSSNVIGAPGGTSTSAGSSPSGAAAGSQSSWWSTALTALTKGVVSGATTPGIVPCISPGVPAGCVTIPVVTPPWYTTPAGMLGIALTVGLGYFLLKK